MAKEAIKRLTPVKETLRELYLKSGNQCAFPGCERIILNSDGVFVGETCHIEAAEAGGERFNEEMTNEDRRAFSNLMLLCGEHHAVTNDTAKYTVKILQGMKAEHEAKFTDVADKIEQAFVDRTASPVAKMAVTFNQIHKILNWNHNDEERGLVTEDAKWLFESLSKLPQKTRQLLSVVVSRMTESRRHQRYWREYKYSHNVPLLEVAEVCNQHPKRVFEHVEIMDRYGVATPYLPIGETDEIELRESPNGYFTWSDILEFSNRAGVPLKALLSELRFDLMD